jgi:hypothetical protein
VLELVPCYRETLLRHHEIRRPDLKRSRLIDRPVNYDKLLLAGGCSIIAKAMRSLYAPVGL